MLALAQQVRLTDFSAQFLTLHATTVETTVLISAKNEPTSARTDAGYHKQRSQMTTVNSY